MKLVLRLLKAAEVDLSVDDCLTYQNVPELRSLPTIAHSHVFLRTNRLSESSHAALSRMRRRWRDRSPWLQAERTGGARGKP